MKKLHITRNAYKFLKDLQAKQYRQVAQKMLSLMVDDNPADSSLLKNSEFWRADIGEYRIVYRSDETTVYITLIGKRNGDDIYKQLERL